MEDQEVCECGHKKCEHNSWGTECYKTLRRKDGVYQCVCRDYKEKVQK